MGDRYQVVRALFGDRHEVAPKEISPFLYPQCVCMCTYRVLEGPNLHLFALISVVASNSQFFIVLSVSFNMCTVINEATPEFHYRVVFRVRRSIPILVIDLGFWLCLSVVTLSLQYRIIGHELYNLNVDHSLEQS